MKNKNYIISSKVLKFKIGMFFSNIKFFLYNFQRKNLKIFKFFDQRRIGSIPRIFISSLIIMFIFYMVPIFINYGNKNFFVKKEFKNDSKKILAYTLNQKNNGIDSNNNDTLDEKELLFDIFSLNDLETDSVRLDATTIKQLFDDTN